MSKGSKGSKGSNIPKSIEPAELNEEYESLGHFPSMQFELPCFAYGLA